MKRIMIIFICVIFLGSYGITQAARNEPPSAPVTVVNTTSNPVPVTGDVVISGTPDVNVINPNSSPVPVLNMDDVFSGVKMYQNRGCNVNFVSDSTSAECTPGGPKPQVIEQVSAHAYLGASHEGILFVRITNDSDSVEKYTHVIPLISVNGILFGTQLTQLYVPEGFSLTFQIELDSTISVGAARIDFSGYSVQQP